jgi:hypothetical protein
MHVLCAELATDTATNNQGDGLKRIVFGIMNIDPSSKQQDLDDPSIWSTIQILKDWHVSVLTGWFGDLKESVDSICTTCGALSELPIVQPFHMATIEAPERDFKFLPSYQIFFGGCKSYKSPVTTSAPYWHEWSDVSDPSPADYDRTMHLSLHKLLLNWSRLTRWAMSPECESAVVGTAPK